MMLLSVVPLSVFLIILALIAVQSADRFQVLQDFTTIVDSRAASGPLRKNINRQFDALLLGEPQNRSQAQQRMAQTIRARERKDFGRFSDVIEKQRETALRAEALLTTAYAEFEQTGTVSPATSGALETALEALYLAAVQANASFHVEKLPIENAKYAFLQAWDLHVSLTQNRRLVIAVLRNGVLTRSDALRLLQQVKRMEQQVLRFRTMAKSIDWERAAQFIGEYAAPVEQYLAQPVLQELQDRLAPQALESGRTPVAFAAFPTPTATAWYASQRELEQRSEQAFAQGLQAAQQEARQLIVREALGYLAILALVLGAIGFSWRKGRSFGRTLADDVSRMRTTLADADTTNDLLLEASPGSTSEIEQIVEATNALLHKLRSHDRRIQDLLSQSQDREEELARQAEEIEASNEELLMQARELEHANQHILAHAGEVAQANQYKSEFLANMSHELRTPLNSILVLSKLIAADQNGYLQEDDVEGVQVIHEAGRALLSLINDILDLSRIEAGKMEATLSQVSLRDLADTLARRYQPIAADKGLRLTNRVARDIPEQLETDERMLTQIVTNLISNAIKFTAEGGVTVDYGIREEGVVHITVTDSGIGIPAEKLHRVFNAFEQVDGSVSRKYGGTGLGLALAKQMTMMLGGDLSVHSQPGKGSTFTLLLPVTGGQAGAEVTSGRGDPVAPFEHDETQPRTGAGRARGTSEAAGALAGRCIHLFDDDARFAHAISRVVQHSGATLCHHTSAANCLEQLDAYREQVDLVIMDIMMPEKDGLEAIADIRSQARFRDLPIIAHTARNMATDREACLNAGASAYLQKSASPEALLEVAAALLEEDTAAA